MKIIVKCTIVYYVLSALWIGRREPWRPNAAIVQRRSINFRSWVDKVAQVVATAVQTGNKDAQNDSSGHQIPPKV